MSSSSSTAVSGAVLTPPGRHADVTAAVPSHVASLHDDGGRHDLDTLFRDNGLACYQLARSVLRDSHLAEDAVQEAFLQHWRQAGRYDPRRSSARSWLLLLTYRKAVDRVRHEELRRVSTLDGSQDQASAERGPEDRAVASGLGDRVRQALATLPTSQRESIALAYWGGYTQVEVAAITGAPLGTVKTRMRSGMISLRMALGDERDQLR